MGKYGTTALEAIALARARGTAPDAAWRSVAAEVFAGAPEGMRKVCPRETFLGLCQAGLVRGISGDDAGNRQLGANRQYAVAAVRLLARTPTLAREKKTELWRRVMGSAGADSGKKHNQQLDVVLTLWNEGLIDTDAL